MSDKFVKFAFGVFFNETNFLHVSYFLTDPHVFMLLHYIKSEVDEIDISVLF